MHFIHYRFMATAALCAALAGGCSDDAGGIAAGPQTFTLSDGVVVAVSATGQVALSLEGRPLWTMSESEHPVVRRFSETAFGPLAIWEFTRQDIEQSDLGIYVGARQQGDAVVVEYADTSGADTATLTIAPERAGATRVTLAHQGSAPADSLAMALACDSEASFYGFGGQYHQLDQRGQAFSLWVSEQGIGRNPDDPVLPTNGSAHTTYFPMPYFVDARGWGALVRTEYRVDVDLCRSDAQAAWFEVVSGEPFEWLVFHGPAINDVIGQLGDEVGRPKAPPSWAYELWIGAQGGTQAILDEADALEAAAIPARVLWVQDWTGVRPNFGGGFGVQYRWRADLEHYPDLAGMIATLKSRGYRFLAYVNPFIDTQLEHHAEMAPQGLLIHREDGTVYDHAAPNGFSSHPDLSNPATREYVKAELRAMVQTYDMDGWMADFGEWLPVDAVLADGSDARAYHNRYPVEWHRMSREVMDELRPDGDWVVFARSGFTGVHQVSQIHWVGDQEADFSPHDGLPTVVPAMLNLGLSGIPYVTHDIAGFSGGPSTKELFMRWTELGAFTPIMRTHEGNNRLENWSWNSDAETTDHFRRFARVHAALADEFRALAGQAAQTSIPVLRPLMMVFPDDAPSRAISDQFMIGEGLLVAPVVEQGATTRAVYLPPGTWFHVWTGDSYQGGMTHSIDAPIGAPPVFSWNADRADLRAIQ